MELITGFLEDNSRLRDNVKYGVVHGVRIKFDRTFRQTEINVIQGLLSLANVAQDIDSYLVGMIRNQLVSKNFRFFAACAVCEQRGVAADANVMKSIVNDIKLVSPKDVSVLEYICECHENGIIPFVGTLGSRGIFGVDDVYHFKAEPGAGKSLAIWGKTANFVKFHGPQVNRDIPFSTVTKRFRDSGRALIVPNEWTSPLEAMLIIDSDTDVMIRFTCNWDDGFCIWMDQIVTMIERFQTLIRRNMYFEIQAARTEVEFCQKNIKILLRELHYGAVTFNFEVFGDANGIPSRVNEDEFWDVSNCIGWAVTRQTALEDAPCYGNLNVTTFGGVLNFYYSLIACIEMYTLFDVIKVKSTASSRNLLL